jgi:hypothetical protein
LAPEVPDQAQLFVSQGLTGIEGDRPDELDDLLDVNEPQDLRDRTRQTETAGVGWEFLEEEEEQEGHKGRVLPAKKDLPQSGTLEQTSVPMPDPATSQCPKLGFEYGILAPAKLLAGSYRLLTAASNIQQWGSLDDEQSDGVRQWSPAAPNCGGEGKCVEGKASGSKSASPAPCDKLISRPCDKELPAASHFGPDSLVYTDETIRI